MQNCQHTVKVKSLCFRAELAQAAMPPLVVDAVSFGVGVAEGAYLVTQADTAEERMMGLIPLALAPLDLVGVASSGNDLLKSIKMIKTTKAGTKVTQALDDIDGASVGKATLTDVARTRGTLSHSGTIAEEVTEVPSFSPKLLKSKEAVRLSDIIDEQLEDIRRGMEELDRLEVEMNEMLQGYPQGTAPLAEAEDFIELDVNNQVMLQRIGQPEIKPGRWGGVLQDHGEPVAAVRSSRGDYIFSDTKIGSRSIGVSANSKGQILSYLDAHSSHVVTSDIEGQSKIYVRVVPRPDTARFNGKFPVEDATKAVINGFTNFGVRWGGIPAPIIPGLEGVTPGAIGKPLSSLVARGKKLDFLGRLKMLVGWEKSVKGGQGHGVMLEISPYPGPGMVEITKEKVTFGDIANALKKEAPPTDTDKVKLDSDVLSGRDGLGLTTKLSLIDKINRSIQNGKPDKTMKRILSLESKLDLTEPKNQSKFEAVVTPLWQDSCHC